MVWIEEVFGPWAFSDGTSVSLHLGSVISSGWELKSHCLSLQGSISEGLGSFLCFSLQSFV